jgi:cyclopropane fatty-acyl-phospholipid synthase-like methyltransferase
MRMKRLAVHSAHRAPRTTCAAPSFDELYARPTPAFGSAPTAALCAWLSACAAPGEALDLGAGAGRDALCMAQHGWRVTAIDRSARGIVRLREAAARRRLAHRINARIDDVRRLHWAHRKYDLVAAVTLLDHLEAHDMPAVWQAMIRSLGDGGVLVVEVHTTDDPGSPVGRGRHNAAPVSESAAHVRRYFDPAELREMAAPRLRVLHIDRRLEWDRTHGPLHQHGKATLIATRC